MAMKPMERATSPADVCEEELKPCQASSSSVMRSTPMPASDRRTRTESNTSVRRTRTESNVSQKSKSDSDSEGSEERSDDEVVAQMPNSPVPSLFTPERKHLQYVCLVVLAISASGNVSMFDRLSAPFVLPDLEWAGQALDLDYALSGRALPHQLFYVAVALGVIFLFTSIREAIRFPRVVAHRRKRDILRTLLQFAGDLLLTPIRALLPAEKVDIRCQPTAQNKELLANCPSLKTFKQTPWCHNVFVAFGVLQIFDNWRLPYWQKFVRREELTCPDGGVVCLDWWEEDKAACEKADKILFIGSTFTGDSLVSCTRTIVRHFSARGYRCVTMVKRGCGLTMPNPQPCMNNPEGKAPKSWHLTGYDDIKFSIDAVAAMYPGQPIVGIGLSTGSVQLREYVNRTGPEAKLSAAVLVDAAQGWLEACLSCDLRVPLLSFVLGDVALKTMPLCGHPPSEEPLKGHEEYGPRWGYLMEFVRKTMAPAYGYEPTVEGTLAFFNETCVIPDAEKCAIPVLETLTHNDMIISTEGVREVMDFYKQSPNVITATTRAGTHMVRWQGWSPQCWLTTMSFEFLEASLKRAKKQ